MSRVTVTSAEFQKHFGKYRELALTEPVAITNHGRESLVLVSAAEYERLKERGVRLTYAKNMSEQEREAMEHGLQDAMRSPHGAEFDHEVKG